MRDKFGSNSETLNAAAAGTTEAAPAPAKAGVASPVFPPSGNGYPTAVVSSAGDAILKPPAPAAPVVAVVPAPTAVTDTSKLDNKADSKIDSKVDVKAAAAAPVRFRIRHSSGVYVHPSGGKAEQDTPLVLHSGGETSPYTLFEWVYVNGPPPKPTAAAAAPASVAGKPVAVGSGGGEPLAPGGPAGGKGAPQVNPVGPRHRVLRHVASGLYVHPRHGTPQLDAQLVLWPSANADLAHNIALRAARLDLEAGATANADSDIDEDAEGRDGGAIQITTANRALAVHPKGGEAKPGNNTPLLLHKPGASAVVTFRFMHASP